MAIYMNSLELGLMIIYGIFMLYWLVSEISNLAMALTMVQNQLVAKKHHC